MPSEFKIEGECDRRFDNVRKAFAENFDQRGELGAAVSIVMDGRPLVDLWGGYADRAKGRPWQRDTLVNVYSTTKGLTATCAHRLIDQGKLDPDEPVAKYWPEFAQRGKNELPVRYVLSHRAGLPAIKKPLAETAIYDWETMVRALEEQEPWWQPGTKHGYHALTIGWLAGELIRRITGKGLGTYFRTEIAEPLGLDAHIGLDAKHDSRVSDLLPAPPPEPGQPDIIAEAQRDPQGLTACTFLNPPILSKPDVVNTRAWRAAEIGGGNGHTNARSLARLYGALARGGELDGYRIVRPESLERFWAEQSFGPDQVLMQLPTRFSMGFMLSQPGMGFGPNIKAFGHPGAGGSLGFADPVKKIGFGYTMNQMANGLLIDSRAAALINAFYASLQ
ncbi:MAG TPA: serine hydrolase domain-containing protein [Candidatus Binataceae bacterium]|nr:serine hydrolase domain-containing protein [Candidatus Binataceae bacterium]